MAGQQNYLTLLEARDRRPRMTTQGSEIVITWYCEPATAAPMVISQLLGGVTGNTANDTRNLPAADFAFPFCYCVAARESPMDPRACNSGPGLSNADWSKGLGDINTIGTALDAPIIFDGPLSLDSDGNYIPLPQASDNRGRCGAYIEAIYRPLYTVYNFPTQGSAGATDLQNSFDYIDPQMVPCSRTVDVSSSLYVLYDAAGGSYGQSCQGGPQFTETWEEFTIRRVLCPSVPWLTIKCLQNRINANPWKPAKFTIDGLPNNTFPVGTVRFDTADVIPRVVPSCLDPGGNVLISPNGLPITRAVRCYDIVLKFSYRTTTAYWIDNQGKLRGQTDGNGNIIGPAQITWNCEWFPGIGYSGVLSSPILTLGSNKFWPAGWYESGFWTFNLNGDPTTKATNPVIYNKAQTKYLNGEDPTLPITAAGGYAIWDTLFLQNSP